LVPRRNDDRDRNLLMPSSLYRRSADAQDRDPEDLESYDAD
jgi:hypothetical protein